MLSHLAVMSVLVTGVLAVGITDSVSVSSVGEGNVLFAGASLNETAIAADSVVTADSAMTTTEMSGLQKIQQMFGSFETTMSKLPTSGKSTRATWANTYWPTYLDSINYRFAGENTLAPSEKYSKAFGISGNAFANAVSQQHGILGKQSGQSCNSNSDCQNNLQCGKQTGQTTGKCIAAWEGICDGWVAASLLVDEPKCDVTYNGVTFTSGDLKALLSAAFADNNGRNYQSAMLSSRCNTEKPQTNANGDFTDEACRDLTPGMFHLFITNMLGRFKLPFAFDQTATAEVWNQPVTGFTIKERQDITRAQAVQYLGANYQFAPTAATFIAVGTGLNWITEAPFTALVAHTDNVTKYTQTTYYTYILELDAAGKIVGGEWIGKSKAAHPDFIWTVNPKNWNKQSTTYGYLQYNVLGQLAAKSSACK